MAKNKEKIQQAALHIMLCVLMLLLPLMFLNSDERISWRQYALQVAMPIALLAIFYINYFFLAPCILLRNHRLRFFIINIVIVVVAAYSIHEWMDLWFRMDNPRPARIEAVKRKPPVKEEKHGPSFFFFFFRDIFNFSLAATMASAIVLARKWSEAEKARTEAEKARTEAELRNLRNQVNPHFLLNTLNNIYALTAFDQSKAQDAIIELSKLLRHILYDNQQEYGLLADEVQFIHSYVKLMKMRLPSTVDISEDISLPDDCAIRIAPMILISLVENAFKHGISPVKPSFIHIDISADWDRIVCDIENSNHPKADSDRSGHGIGLTQVARRLELSYPGKYSWSKGCDPETNTYKSHIEIYDTEMCNH